MISFVPLRVELVSNLVITPSIQMVVGFSINSVGRTIENSSLSVSPET